MDDRVSIFIDGSNFYHALKEVHKRVDLDFEAFVNIFSLLPDGTTRIISPVHYYNSVLDRSRHPITYANQQRFFSHLEKIVSPKFLIFRGRIDYHGNLKYRCRSCEKYFEVSEQVCPDCHQREKLVNSVEKGVDVSLAVDMVSGALNNDYDICLLISEDSDFVPALEQVKKIGKRVELGTLASKNRKRGYLLIQTADWTHYIQRRELTWLH